MMEVYIEEEIGQVVAATNTALAAAGFPSEVFYMYGHVKEVAQRLQQISESAAKTRYPLIILFTDIPIKKKLGWYGDARLQVVIVTHAMENAHAPDRLENVFKPILEPIKMEFLNQLSTHPQFTRPGELMYTQVRHYFWGSQLNNANPLNDKLDAIELRDIEITIKNKFCEPVTTTVMA